MEQVQQAKDDVTSTDTLQEERSEIAPDAKSGEDQCFAEPGNNGGNHANSKEDETVSSSTLGGAEDMVANATGCHDVDAGKVDDEMVGQQCTDDESSKQVEGDDPMDADELAGRRAEFTSEIFKIMLRNLPSRFGFQQLRKMLDGLQLKPKKIKAVNRKDYAFVTFLCEEDRQKAIEVLNQHIWKGRKLSAKIAKAIEDPMVAYKRKQESQGGDGKRSREDEEPDKDLPIEERLNNAVTPLWRQDYQEQLKEKQQTKEDLLKKFTDMLLKQVPESRKHINAQREKHNGSCCPMEDIKSSPITTGYRNKCEFSIGSNPEGEEKTVGFRLGLYKGGQISVVNPAACLNVPDKSKAVVQAFQTFIRQSDLDAYDPVTHKGHWRMLTVRTTQGSDLMAMVTFHCQSLSEDEVEKEKQKLAEYFGTGEGKACGVTSLFIHVQWQGDKNAIQFDHIYGEQHIAENLLQLKFRISPQAFFQVNTPAAELLYTTIGNWAQVSKITTLLDICCGTGTIGISLAKKVEKVIGVEMNEQAVEDAKENASINGVDNITFHCGKAEDLLPGITKKLHGSLDVVGIVDPPRGGLQHRVVQAIRRCPKLNRLIYVSCDAKQALNNFMNLCRSMSKKQKGVPFTLVKAIPVDLFPHTSHCELVLLFERNLKGADSNSNDDGGAST